MLTQREIFFKHIAQTSPSPLALEIDSAKGTFIYDVSGKAYYDMISGISVSSVGHCNPKVVEAIRVQTEKYMHLMVYGEYIQTPQNHLAQKIVSLLPSNLSSVYFVNSGSEAIEGAIKIVRKYTNRSEIISCYNAYHGSTLGALSAIGSIEYKKWFAPVITGFSNIEFGKIEDLDKITKKTAAIIIEPVQAEAGIRIAKSDYWKTLQIRCKETGTLIIADEVQTGFGRTGKMFGFEYANFIPDIITFAKGMGGGMPIGAFVSSSKIMNCLTNNPILGHITTFGGHPVSCAASLACINAIIDEKLIDDIEYKSNFVVNKLQNAPLIKEIRNAGFLFAIEFESFKLNKQIIDNCIKNGVITDWFLFCDNSMRLAPPLTISMVELEDALNIIISVLKNIKDDR